MIIYFEDGPLTDESMATINDDDIAIIDAGLGYSICRRKLKIIREHLPFNTKVYTNSLDAFSNTWCWDKEKKIPMIYIKNKNNEWKLISELTTRELRPSLSISKLYVNGIFCEVETL